MKISEETFGQCLRRRRKEKGLTQKKAARQLGFTVGLLSDFENDKVAPHFRHGIHLVQFMAQTGEKRPVAELLTELQQLIDRTFVYPNPIPQPGKEAS